MRRFFSARPPVWIRATRKRAPAAAKRKRTIRAGLKSDGLKGARIGVARKRFFGYSKVTDRLIEAAIGDLKAAGATIVDPADVPNAGSYEETELEVLLYEFKADLNAYLATRKELPVRTLKDLIAFNEREREREMPVIRAGAVRDGGEKGAADRQNLPERTRENLRLSRNRRLSGRLGIDAVMVRHTLDAIVMPTLNPAWPSDLVNGDHFLGGSSTPGSRRGISKRHRSRRLRGTACRSGCRSSAAPGPSRRCSGSRTPTSRRRTIGGRRRFHPTADLNSSTKFEVRELRNELTLVYF